MDGGRPILEIRTGAQGDAIEGTQRHDQRPSVAKADHFAGNFLFFSDGYAALTAQADGPGGAGDFHRQALDPRHPAKAGQGGDRFYILEQRAHHFSNWAAGAAKALNPEIFALPQAPFWAQGFKPR